MIRLLTDFVGALIEAWQELRIHRTRVLLSLIGVAVAVCSLTTVTALGAVVQQASTEASERASGRPASLYLSVNSTGGVPIDPEVLQQTWEETVKRYDVGFASRSTSGSTVVQFPDGAVDVFLQAVDQPYGTMHRVALSEGAWFTPEDAGRLAPAIIVNPVFWERLGSPPLSSHPTVLLGSLPGTTAVIVGVSKAAPWETEPSMYLLADAYLALAAQQTPSSDPLGGQAPQMQYEMWVPPEISDRLLGLVTSDVQAALGDSAQVDVYRQDYAQYGDDSYRTTQIVIGSIAGLVLVLGALSLVNIALVTVRQRVREIGIRRSFGATASRVFFSVMMESVVATVAAGAAGVMASVLIVKNPVVEGFVGQGLTDFPPFPVDAALMGLAAATAVGALAGLLPALVAVRVKVIDAIRY